jgi:hypothetical protein
VLARTADFDASCRWEKGLAGLLRRPAPFSGRRLAPIRTAMGQDRPPKPLVSTRADDPEIEERLDAFVLGLGETVDTLQDAEAAGAHALLEGLARDLAVLAEELGYPLMAQGARRVAAASRERSPEAAHKAVSGLTELAQRIRRGHRSAA